MSVHDKDNELIFENYISKPIQENIDEPVDGYNVSPIEILQHSVKLLSRHFSKTQLGTDLDLTLTQVIDNIKDTITHLQKQ